MSRQPEEVHQWAKTSILNGIARRVQKRNIAMLDGIV